MAHVSTLYVQHVNGESLLLSEGSHTPKARPVLKKNPERVKKVPINDMLSFWSRLCGWRWWMEVMGGWVGGWTPERNDKGCYH